MSNLKVAFPCPHCFQVGTFQTGFSTTPNGNGQSAAQCLKCHKTFWIEVKQGQVTGTNK